MRNLILLLIWFFTYAGLFFLISTLGMLFTTYHNVISSPGWLVMYTILIGSWAPAFVASEYYYKHKRYYKDINV